MDGTYGEPETLDEKGTFGEKFEYTPSEEHFSVDESKFNRLSTDSLVLGDAFAVYLKRDAFDIVYHDIIAEDLEDTSEEAGLLYGSDYVIQESMFGPYDGFRFAGWATEADGEVNADYAVGTELTVSGKLDLYAVWDVACIDRTGGFDYIYVLQAESCKVILERGGIEFGGTIDADGVFTVETEGAKLTGKVNAATESFMYEGLIQEGTYLYYDQYYSEKPLTDAERIDDKVTLVLDKYGEGTLTTGGEAYEGVCVALEGGEWSFYIDEENFYYFVMQKVGDKNCFTISGDEYGQYSEATSTLAFLDGAGDGLLTLDGYGHAVVRDAYHREDYDADYFLDLERSSMSEDGSLIILCVGLHVYDFDGWLFGKKTETQGEYVDITVYCILMYDEEADGYVMLYIFEDTDALGEFKDGANTLKLDGFGQYKDSATLTEGEKVTKGGFFSYQSILGTIVEFEQADGTMRYFRLNEDKTYKELDGKPTEFINLHADTYGRSEFGGPYLVMYGEDVKTGVPTEVYVPFGAESDPEYKLVATGTCTATAQGGHNVYTLTVKETVDEESCPFRSIVFLTGELYTGNEVLVRAYYILTADNVVGYKTFTGEDGAVIWFADFGYNGVGAFYKAADGTVLEGSFSIVNGSIYWFEGNPQYGIFRYADDGKWAYRFFELKNGTDSGNLKTFTEIDALPYLLYEGKNTNGYDEENFCVGPNGVAQFKVMNENLDMIGVVKGTYTAVGKTVCGDDIYRFDPEENEWDVKSFEFVIEMDHYYMGETVDVYHKKVTDPKVQLEFEVDDGSTLKSDGFWYKGVYDGILGELEGLLYNSVDVDDNKVIVFETEEYDALIFDILPDGTLTMRDGLDGYFKLLDENSENFKDWLLYLDGYGNVTVDDWNAGTIHGYYEMNEYGIVEIALDMGNTVWMQMDVVLYSDDGNYAVLIDYEVMGLYVASDLSMLYLDGMNIESFYIDELGNVYGGDYFLFDEFGVFNFSDGSVIVFTYDSEELTFEKVDQSKYYGVYFANNMRDYYVFDETVYTKDHDQAGYYLVEETEEGLEITMYLLGGYGSKFSETTATVVDDVLTVGYYSTFYKLPKEVTLTGTATFDGETQIEDLTLTFTIDDIDGPYVGTLTYGTVELEVEISGWNWLYMYYTPVGGFEESPEIDFNLKTNSFTIACESDAEIAALKATLGIATDPVTP